MDTLSQPYLALIAGAALLWWIVRTPQLRGWVALASGAAFFASPLALHRDWPMEKKLCPLVMFAAAVVITAAGVRAVAAAPPESRARRAVLPVALLTIALVAWKAIAAPWWPAGAGSIASIGFPLGLSYYVLRSIAAVVETSRGTWREPTLAETAGFLGFAPMLAVGPIDRPSSFWKQGRATPALRDGAALAGEGAGRIVEGLFKLLVLSETLARFSKPFHGLPTQTTAVTAGVPPEELWRGLYCYSLYLYVNFSGASDLAIGAARFFGLKLAENFELPYARPNLSEFWRGWHMSLSTWLRDFLFFPIGRRLPRDFAPIVAPLLVMSLCGLWHGLTVPFLIWGLLHGAGLAIHQLWLKLRRASAAVDALAGNFVARTLFAVVTAQFVAFTWIFFTAPRLGDALANIASMYESAGRAWYSIVVSCCVVAAWSFCPGVRDWLRERAKRAEASIVGLMASLWRVHVDVVLLLIVVARLMYAQTQPEGAFVYQGF